ncbi:MAG: 3-dehydroquinate synthase [Elusimicrobia bacterium]|nr:3-dehydroquinate synthase [Elusimicrobiota bacterium]
MNRSVLKLSAGRSHDIIVGARLENLGRALSHVVSGRRALVVSASPIARRYARTVLKGLRSAGFETALGLMPDGESHKTMAVVQRLYRHALSAQLDRRSILIALGGGVVGDVAGFVAATYMRGIPFVQCPTTLLAMVDASVGGKTGVDLPEGKNLVGAFWQPKLVWMDMFTLSTLPDRQWRTGIAEIIKYGMMADRALFELLENNDLARLKKSPKFLETLVARSAAIKARVVSKDERETTGLRATLNLGHTFAHAIETVSGYKTYTHGEAVAIGLCAAARLGVCVGTFPLSGVPRVDALVTRWGLSTRVKRALSRPKILAAMARDKKSVNGGFRFVVPVGIGRAKVVAHVPPDIVVRILKEIGL